jgi:hypothetical protein
MWVWADSKYSKYKVEVSENWDKTLRALLELKPPSHMPLFLTHYNLVYLKDFVASLKK